MSQPKGMGVYNPSTWQVGQVDHEFEVSLSYTVKHCADSRGCIALTECSPRMCEAVGASVTSSVSLTLTLDKETVLLTANFSCAVQFMAWLFIALC